MFVRWTCSLLIKRVSEVTGMCTQWYQSPYWMKILMSFHAKYLLFWFSVSLFNYLVHFVCLWSRSYFISIECYILKFEHCRTRIRTRACSFAVFWLNLANCTESRLELTCTERSEIIFLLCRPVSGSETKLKIIPNMKLTFVKDVVKDTKNRHGDLM